jgi:single-stranded-DNA-specific exonuclease
MNHLELLQELLIKRGYNTPELQDRFLNPKYDFHTYDPFLLSDMQIGIERIFTAMLNDEKICVYSDYDADGIPGAVVMHDFFKKIGYKNVMFYIPHRHTEGYGLHLDALDKIAAEGATLMITVDLGITAHKEVIYAKELGIEVIVTDHHEPLETVPEAYAIINPKIPVVFSPSFRGSGEVRAEGVQEIQYSSVLRTAPLQEEQELHYYPDTMICGCATAFKLVQGMLKVLRKEKDISIDIAKIFEKVSVPIIGWEKWLLDMVGIATLSDMVPLINENRVLATYGLQVLRKTKRPGLIAMYQNMRMYQANLTGDDIVFSITPRLNAASRMAHPEIAFQLLTTDSFQTATEITKQLSKLNDERKLEVARAVKQVHKKLTGRDDLPNVLVVGDPEWSPGVLGLIASKIVEEYDRSAFVWCIEGDSVKGSCRARNGDHVVDLMNEVSDQFTQYGGHEGAGGFAMVKENIHFLEDLLNKAGEKIFTHHDGTELIRENVMHDVVISISDITRDLHKALTILSPFGLGNRSPVFLLSRVKPIVIQSFGKGKEHLEMTFQNGYGTVRAIQFFTKPERYKLDPENPCEIDIYGHVEYSVFMGKGELRMRILDIKI